MELAESQARGNLSPGGTTIAAVICTRDRPRALLETLDSIWAQIRRPDELIVIDDGELPERVAAGIGDRCRELGIAYQYRRTESPGLTKARNLAADISTSDVLQYLDDDVTCEPGFLAEVARLMGDPRVGGVTATVFEPEFSSFSSGLYQFGYVVAGWWKVGPRGCPAGPRPTVLARPDEAAPARWLSGAAMALRRDVVRRWRFDEALAEYGLGEDREFGYRVGPHVWFIQARRACVTHRREPSRRTDARRLGFMSSYNYLRILGRTCRLRTGDWLVIGWSFLVLAAMHVAWGILGNHRAHFGELCGMIAGLIAALGELGLARYPDGRHGRSTWHGRGSERPCSAQVEHGRSEPRPCHEPCHLSTPLRVLFVTTNLEPGGAERMLVTLVKHLPRYGVQPSVLCLKAAGGLAGQCRASGTTVIEKVLHYKADALVLGRIGRVIRRNRIHVLVVAHSGGDRMFWGTLAGWGCGLPVVVWSHWFPTPANRHIEPANRVLYPLVDRFVALGRGHSAALSRHAFVPASRIAVIPNAIEVDAFREMASRAEARERLGLSEGQIGVGIIANLRPEKRHDVFIEAARRLAGINPQLRFFIIGDGPGRVGVHSAAAASGIEGEILRLLGWRCDAVELLGGLDICCLCSEVECLSLVALEAAVAGCAFIGPDVGSIPEHIKHRRTGLLIRPADVASLTDAIAELSSDPKLRRELADAALEKALREYGVGKMAGAFAEMLRSVCRRRG